MTPVRYSLLVVALVLSCSACTSSKRAPATPPRATRPTAATKPAAASVESSAAAPQQLTAPPIPTNPPIVAEGPLTLRGVEVSDAVPVRPTQYGVLIDRATNTLLVGKSYVERTSFRVTLHGAKPSYPAHGVVWVKLAENQWAAVQAAKQVAIQPAE